MSTVRIPARADFHEPTVLRLIVGHGRIALGGGLTRITRHRHTSAAVIVGLDRPLQITTERTHVARAALIAAGCDHAVGVSGRIAVFLLPIDAVAHVSDAAIQELSGEDSWRELGEAVVRGELDDFSLVDRALRRGAPHARAIDDRLGRVLDEVARTLDENVPIEALSDRVGLSPSRLMALARTHLGTSLRGYRRWLRTFEVARRYAHGASLTDAALDAGFASSAHLAATSRASFGVRPSQVLSPHSRASIHVLA